ncbi:hypothetical protein [Paenibacillus glycanilyticus]|uniref:Uncharacterized protein n=1 Tax=Paenibacillus glycanilyticus TaxID=126569 RepID=A0ABQ6G7T3_9BACL|nr:hypothetical protein [Paenibacillus glycanilyticus]GLX67018.1 hypothetical protein MU1_13620 [Paenibacillus glycanilyticus]
MVTATYACIFIMMFLMIIIVDMFVAQDSFMTSFKELMAGRQKLLAYIGYGLLASLISDIGIARRKRANAASQEEGASK